MPSQCLSKNVVLHNLQPFMNPVECIRKNKLMVPLVPLLVHYILYCFCPSTMYDDRFPFLSFLKPKQQSKKHLTIPTSNHTIGRSLCFIIDRYYLVLLLWNLFYFPLFVACSNHQNYNHTISIITDPIMSQDSNYFSPHSIMYDPSMNKDTAFSAEDRAKFGLRGLLPPRIETMTHQLVRALKQFRSFKNPLDKYIYLMSLQARNTTLFFRLLVDNMVEMLPIGKLNICKNYNQFRTIISHG